MTWGTFLAFWIGGFAGAALLAYLERGANDDRARAHWEAQQQAIRFYSLLRYTQAKDLRCPEGADFNGWLTIVETAMVKDEAERLERTGQTVGEQ